MADSTRKSGKKTPARQKQKRTPPGEGDYPAGIWAFRRPERQILICAIFLVGAGFFSILGSTLVEFGGDPDWRQWIPFGGWVLSLLLLHGLFLGTGSRTDPVVTGLGLSLVGLGLLAQYRMQVFEGVFVADNWKSPGALAFPLGIAAMIGAHQAFRQDRYRFLRRGWVLWLVMALGVVAFVLLTGRRFRGAVMAAGNMTPTEILKLLVPLAVAGFLSRKEVDTPAGRKGKGKGKAGAGSEALEWGPLMGFAAMLMLIIGGLVYQKDLGMVLILSVSIGFQIFAGTGAWWILPLMAFGMIGGVGIVQKLFPHALARFDVWLNPFADPTGGGWQILQSFSGMYSGGLWGEGWGQGDPERIPIAKSDFIYSVVAEEMGFLGCLLLIAVFCIFINRAWRIAESVPTRFGCLLGSGLVSVFAVQLLVNIGGVVKVLPMTGVPLIFVSHGGTSLVTSLLILGFILSLNDSAANFPGNTRKKTPSRNRGR